jgi:hypothetical protein
VLDSQNERFAGGERLAEMVMGLAGTCERIVGLLRDGSLRLDAAEDGPLADAILGIVSIRQRLWGALALAPTNDASDTPEEVSFVARRGLLR